jgi:hypothetical protein
MSKNVSTPLGMRAAKAAIYPVRLKNKQLRSIQKHFPSGYYIVPEATPEE